MGKTYSVLGNFITPAKTVRCGDGEYPVLSMTMHNGIVMQSERFKKRLASKDQSDYKVVKRGQLVVGFPIDEGVLYIQEAADEGIMSPAYNVWNVRQGAIEPAYLELCLHSPQSMHYYKNKLRGTTARRRSITTPDLLALPIPLPPLDEQRKIAAALDKIDSLTAKRRRQLEKLDELAKSRFVEMFGTVDSNPFGFPTATLNEVCRKITDGKHGGCEQEVGSGYYYVGAREIYGGSIHYDSAPEITYSDFAKDYKRCNIECGDMVIVNTGATIGKTAIATSPLTTHTLLQKSVALIKVQPEIISAEFLRHCYMANPSMYMVESASAQPNLLLAKMNATRIYLPPLKSQQQFAAFVAATDKSKLAVQQSLATLETLKKSLMQNWFA